MRLLLPIALTLAVAIPPAAAAPATAPFTLVPIRHAHNPWRIAWVPSADAARPSVRAVMFDVPAADIASTAPASDDDEAQRQRRRVAVEYSDAYRTRLKIHRYASFAMLPLFGAELALGQSLYNSSANVGGKRAAHGFIGAGIVGLFAVDTVTGAWNMFGESRKDPNHRTLKLVHGLLMMAADAGFLATEASGPNSRSARQALTFETNKVTHRNIAIASMSVATFSYLIMLIGNR